jgi:DNA-binding MarR family transcriptional regulator
MSLMMLDAYGRTIGEPYSRWQIADVLGLFDHCARRSQTWQKELCDATGVGSSKVNRFIDVAEKRGWIERPKSRTSDAKKPLQMTASGRQVIAEFERLCREAVGKNRRTASQEAGGEQRRKKTRRVTDRKAQTLSGNLMDVLNETNALDKSEESAE